MLNNIKVLWKQHDNDAPQPLQVTVRNRFIFLHSVFYEKRMSKSEKFSCATCSANSLLNAWKLEYSWIKKVEYLNRLLYYLPFLTPLNQSSKWNELVWFVCFYAGTTSHQRPVQWVTPGCLWFRSTLYHGMYEHSLSINPF